MTTPKLEPQLDLSNDDVTITIFSHFSEPEQCRPMLGNCKSPAAYGFAFKNREGIETQPRKTLCRAHALEEMRLVKATNDHARKELARAIEQIEQGKF